MRFAIVSPKAQVEDPVSDVMMQSRTYINHHHQNCIFFYIESWKKIKYTYLRPPVFAVTENQNILGLDGGTPCWGCWSMVYHRHDTRTISKWDLISQANKSVYQKKKPPPTKLEGCSHNVFSFCVNQPLHESIVLHHSRAVNKQTNTWNQK